MRVRRTLFLIFAISALMITILPIDVFALSEFVPNHPILQTKSAISGNSPQSVQTQLSDSRTYVPVLTTEEITLDKGSLEFAPGEIIVKYKNLPNMNSDGGIQVDESDYLASLNEKFGLSIKERVFPSESSASLSRILTKAKAVFNI